MKALIIIDLQQGMFSVPEFVPHDGAGVIARVRSLLDQARAKNTPVFFVQHDGGPDHPLAFGTAGFEIVPELAPMPGEPVIVKRKCNMFQDTALDPALKQGRITHLVICGMQSEYCVDTGVRAAVDRGYEVTLVSDGHTTGDTPDLAAAQVIAHHNHILAGDFAEVRPGSAIQFG
jgi:nicotinamidase-related amidase